MSKPLEIIAGTPDKPLIIPGTDIAIEVYVLEGEQRVLSQRGFAAALGISRKDIRPHSAGAEIPLFAPHRNIKPFVSNDLMLGLKSPILFKNPRGGGVAYGYPATNLPDLCDSVLDARNAGTLSKYQYSLAYQCELLMRGLARVGIIALVDEATGYQDIRAKNTLVKILEAYIADHWKPWTRTFPIEFYKEIYRLKKWHWLDPLKRPSVIGKYTNEIVYRRLAPGVLAELQSRNPVESSGYRKVKHHQWFTPDLGHPKLKEHLAAIMALMRAAPNWNYFIRSLERSFPVTGDQCNFDMD